MLLNIGNFGYQVGAAGIILFSIAFFVIVRWWTDLLGRVIAGVLFSMSSVLVMTTVRMVSPDLATDHTYLTIRVIVFWIFGAGIWTGLGSFVWAQFLAPRLRKPGRMTTRKEYHSEEADLADSRSGRDDDSHNREGSVI